MSASEVIDMTGQRIGLLTVVRRDGSDKQGKARWVVVCDCGEQLRVAGRRLRRGERTSCRECETTPLPDRPVRQGPPVESTRMGTMLVRVSDQVIRHRIQSGDDEVIPRRKLDSRSMPYRGDWFTYPWPLPAANNPEEHAA